MRYAFPRQLGRRLFGQQLVFTAEGVRHRFSDVELADESFWASLSPVVRRAARRELYSLLRSWQEKGHLRRWRVEQTDADTATMALRVTCPREWVRVKSFANVHSPDAMAGWLLHRLWESLDFSLGALMRMLSALEGIGADGYVPARKRASDEVLWPSQAALLAHHGAHSPLSENELSEALRACGKAGSDDLRLGPLLRAVMPDAKLVEDALSPIDTNASTDGSVARLGQECLRIARMTVIEDLQDIASILARRWHSDVRDRNMKMFVLRYGAGRASNDSGSTDDEIMSVSGTLQAVGDQFGITRERVRQVTEKMRLALGNRSIHSPAFLRLVEAASKAFPGTGDAYEKDLAHVLGPGLGFTGARRYGEEVLGIQFSMERVRLPAYVNTVDAILWSAGAQKWHRDAYSLAVKMLSGTGAAYMPHVVSSLAESTHSFVTPDAVARVLSTVEAFEWLDGDPSQWFWFGPNAKRSRLTNLIRKMIAVAKLPLDIEDLFAGISRYSAQRLEHLALYPPPPGVVQEICTRMPFLICKQFNKFVAAHPIAPEEELSQTELIVFRHMERRRGVSSRNALTREFLATGELSTVSLDSAIANSPFVRQIDHGVFALRGWPLDVDALRTAQNEVGTSEHGAQSRGSPVMISGDGSTLYQWTVEITNGSLRNGQHSVPAKFGRAIKAGVYRLPEGGSLRISADGERITGIATIASRSNWPVGARVTVQLNPADCSAVLVPVPGTDPGT